MKFIDPFWTKLINITVRCTFLIKGLKFHYQYPGALHLKDKFSIRLYEILTVKKFSPAFLRSCAKKYNFMRWLGWFFIRHYLDAKCLSDQGKQKRMRFIKSENIQSIHL